MKLGQRQADVKLEFGLSRNFRGSHYIVGGVYTLKLDFNNDRRLDVVYTGPPQSDGQALPIIFLQRRNAAGQWRFTNLGRGSGLSTNVPNGAFGALGDLNGDHR